MRSVFPHGAEVPLSAVYNLDLLTLWYKWTRGFSAKSGCGMHAPRFPLVRLAQAEGGGPLWSISGKQRQARMARTCLSVQLVTTALACASLDGISEFWNIL